MTRITYTGPLKSGHVQCPNSGRSFPKKSKESPEGEFSRGQAFEVPEALAIALRFQSPDDWKVEASIEAEVQKRRDEEKANQEAVAKRDEEKAAKLQELHDAVNPLANSDEE